MESNGPRDFFGGSTDLPNHFPPIISGTAAAAPTDASTKTTKPSAEAAATKIQAAERGRSDRKAVKKKQSGLEWMSFFVARGSNQKWDPFFWGKKSWILRGMKF